MAPNTHTQPQSIAQHTSTTHYIRRQCKWRVNKSCHCFCVHSIRSTSILPMRAFFRLVVARRNERNQSMVLLCEGILRTKWVHCSIFTSIHNYYYSGKSVIVITIILVIWCVIKIIDVNVIELLGALWSRMRAPVHTHTRTAYTARFLARTNKFGNEVILIKSVFTIIVMIVVVCR